MIRKSFEIVNLFFVLLSIFVCFLKTGVSFLFLLTIGASYPFYMRFCSFWCKHCTLFLTKWNPHGTRLGKLAVFPDPNWLCAPGTNIMKQSLLYCGKNCLCIERPPQQILPMKNLL